MVRPITWKCPSLSKGIGLLFKEMWQNNVWRLLFYLFLTYFSHPIWGEWPSGLYSLGQVTEVNLGRVRSNSGWVTSEA